MCISKQQAKSFAKLGLHHVCRIARVREADLARIVDGTELTLPALLDAIVAYASTSPVIDIGRSTWRERLERLAGDSLALQYQLGASHDKVNSL